MIQKSEVCRDLELIKSRLLELKKANCLLSDSNKIESIIVSVNELTNSLTLGMTTSITGRNIPSEKCNFCGK